MLFDYFRSPLPTVAVFDIDGVMTTGRFFYSAEGKKLKEFGPDDSDALKRLSDFMSVRFVTADKRGLGISSARIVKDMGYELSLVSADERLTWISSRWDIRSVCYTGDGFHDGPILRQVGLGITTIDSLSSTKRCADFIIPRNGACRFVAEACCLLIDLHESRRLTKTINERGYET